MSRRDIENLYINELAISDPSEIDIEAIAFYKGATVVKRALKGCEARIVGHGDHAVISINSFSSSERQRFSIGHELGHWFRHRGSVGNLCKKNDISANRSSFSKTVSGKEKVANNYAAELLMPQYLFQSCISGSVISFDVIIFIKEMFNVSITAGAIRYVDSCDYPVILSCYGKEGREWFHKSKYVPNHFYPLRYINNSSPGVKSAKAGHSRYKSTEVDADIWIDTIGSENHEVWEVVWPIGNGRFMVFIWWEEEMNSADQSENLLSELTAPNF